MTSRTYNSWKWIVLEKNYVYLISNAEILLDALIKQAMITLREMAVFNSLYHDISGRNYTLIYRVGTIVN